MVLFIRVTFNCTVSYVQSYLVPKPLLRINYFANTGVNHGVRPLWPLPLPVTLRRPNPAHRRHPHTMGDGSCAWFGRRSSSWHCARGQKKCYRLGMRSSRRLGGMLMEMGGVRARITRHIQQSTMVGGGNGRQWGGGADGRR